MTATASNVNWTHTGEDMAHRESPARKLVPGQMGNVAAEGPYNQGIDGIPGNKTRPTYGTAGSEPTNGTSAEQDRSAMNGNTSLYNPILSAAPGGNQTSDYTSTAPRASATSAGARNGEQKSPTLQNVNESNKLADSPNRVTLEGNKETRQPSGSSLTYETREGGRRMSRQSSGMKSPDRGDIAFRSVSREAIRKQSVKNALAPLSKTESARRLAAASRGEDDYDVGAADSSDLKKRRPSLKDKIKARFQKH